MCPTVQASVAFRVIDIACLSVQLGDNAIFNRDSYDCSLCPPSVSVRPKTERPNIDSFSPKHTNTYIGRQ